MKKLLFSAILASAVFCSSCKKSVLAPTVSTVKGTILLSDENDRLLTNNAGTVISVENTNPLITAVTNDKGEFELPEWTTAGLGNIVLQYNHPGYGTLQQFYTASFIDSIKNDKASLTAEFLSPKSTVLVNALTGQLQGDTYRITVNVAVANTAATNGVNIFIQKNKPVVSADDFAGNSTDSRVITIPVVAGDNTYSICLRCSEECGFLQQGDTAYLKAYGNTKSAFTWCYINPVENKMIFPALNHISNSPTISFIMP